MDSLGGEGEQRRRQGEAERFCRLQVDQELELGGLINRDVARFGPFENLVHVIGMRLSSSARSVAAISHGLDVSRYGHITGKRFFGDSAISWR